MEPNPAPVQAVSICAICLTSLNEAEDLVECPDCHAQYHAECWQENEGCAAYGCGNAPEAKPRGVLEIPVSYWGQEQKPCPVCAHVILAAATRCRNCGTTFESARPEERHEYLDRTRRGIRASGMCTVLKILFVLCLFPLSAPFGGLAMAVYFAVNRMRIRELPSLYGALAKIGVIVAVVETISFVAFWILYSRQSTF